jgi:hypothetical protein
MVGWWRRAGEVAALAATLVGCARARPVVREGVVRGRQASFRVGALGPGWQPVGGDADAEWHRPDSGAVILANGECRPGADEPLGVLRNTLLIGFTDRVVRAEKRAMLDGREALASRVGAKLDGVPVEIDAWVLKKDGCVYDLVYAAPPETFAAGRGDFERLVGGFATVAP